MDEDSQRECPICASRNVSFSEREHALVCRDCGNVVAGKPVKLELPKEEAVEVIHEVPTKYKKIEKKLKAKAKKAKAKKKKVKKSKKKVSKKSKPKKKGLLRRLLKKRR